jgi:hypothetical protein
MARNPQGSWAQNRKLNWQLSPPGQRPICGALAYVCFGPIADIGPSTHLGFWPSLIQELPTGSAGLF